MDFSELLGNLSIDPFQFRVLTDNVILMVPPKRQIKNRQEREF